MGRPSLQQLHSTTSHGELKVGCHATAYLSEITCCPLRPTMTPAFTHSPPLFLYSSHPPAFQLYLSISAFYFLVQPDLPSYSRTSTLHWRAASCQEFFQHFYWLRAGSSSSPSLPIGLKALINNAPSLARLCVAVTIDQR